MSDIIIKLEKQDISTTKVGDNIMVETLSNLSLIFSTEALEELISDYNFIKNEIHD